MATVKINAWVTTSTALALDRLAKRYGVTKREMLEKLISAEDAKTSKDIDIDSPEWAEYFNVTA